MHDFVHFSLTFFETLGLTLALFQYFDANFETSAVTNMFNDNFYCCVFWNINQGCLIKSPCTLIVTILERKALNPMLMVSVSSIFIGLIL